MTASSTIPSIVEQSEVVPGLEEFGIRAFTTTKATGSFGLHTDEPVGVVMGRWSALRRELRPSGRRFATAGSDDRTVRIWDVRLGAEVLTLKDHGGVINSLAFSADNRRLVGGLAGKDRVHVWDVPAK